jgi:hypothetical protein
MIRWWPIALAALVASALAACDRPPPPRFPHVEHLAEIECGVPGKPDCLNCASCHGVPDPKTRDLSPPSEQVCAPCHRDASEVRAKAKLPPLPGYGVIRFDHGPHLERPEINGQCVHCHAGIVSDRPGAPVRPPMSTCLECHQADFDRASCTGCHPAADLARTMPESFMRHDVAWLTRHGAAATRSPAVCTQCHAESTCLECHDTTASLRLDQRRPEQVLREMPHRADYVSRHAMDARAQTTRCVSCHTPATCDACHVERGVSAARPGAVNPHPDGWVGRDTRSRDFHGRAARRNLLSCAGCHDQGPATNCIECHRPGGPGGSPHPGRWRSSQSMSEGMCRYCHE